MISQQDGRNCRMLINLLHNVCYGFLRSTWRPISYWNIFSNAETQQCFICARQRLVGKRKTCDVWRMSVNDGVHIRSRTVDTRMHADDLPRYWLKRTRYHFAIKCDDCQLLWCQIGDDATGSQQHMLCFS